MPRKPWYHKGLRFECTRCGNCCRNHGDYEYVYLTEVELQRIPAFLGIERSEFVARYCVKEPGSFHSLRMDRPACPFLAEDQTCGIYPVRPFQCATWPFWEENLKKSTWEGPVKDCCPGIGRGELHSTEEVERVARQTEEWFE